MTKENQKKIKMKVDVSETLRCLPIGDYVDLTVHQASRESVRSTCSQLKKREGKTFRVDIITPITFRVQRCL